MAVCCPLRRGARGHQQLAEQQAVGAHYMDDGQVLAGHLCTVKMVRQPVLHAPFATDLSRWAGFVASHT